jgi:hypothetical protein
LRKLVCFKYDPQKTPKQKEVSMGFPGTLARLKSLLS